MFFVYALVLAVLFACGKNDEPPKVQQIGVAAVANYQSGVCGDPVAADYRAMNLRCSRKYNRQHAVACRSLAESFLGKYPGINCSVRTRDGRFGRHVVTEREIQEILEHVRRLGV